MAEQTAWELAGAQDRWSMVTVNPGLILGPSLTPVSDSGSLRETMLDHYESWRARSGKAR